MALHPSSTIRTTIAPQLSPSFFQIRGPSDHLSPERRKEGRTEVAPTAPICLGEKEEKEEEEEDLAVTKVGSGGGRREGRKDRRKRKEEEEEKKYDCRREREVRGEMGTTAGEEEE